MKKLPVFVTVLIILGTAGATLGKPTLMRIAESEETPAIIIDTLADVPICEVQMKALANPRVDEAILVTHQWSSSRCGYERHLGIASNPKAPQEILDMIFDEANGRYDNSAIHRMTANLILKRDSDN